MNFDWNEIQDQTVNLLRDYLMVNTQNPPGDESKGVKFFTDLLDREGISYKTIEYKEGRGNLIAKINGNGEEKPLILLNHIDVVPYDPKHWHTDPYGGLIKDGYLYGRGALDMKGLAAVQFVVFTMLNKMKDKLKRDVYFIAVANEETGGDYGAKELILKETYLQEAEYLLNEISYIETIDNGEPIICPIMVGEKYPFQFRLIADGDPGHGSMPHKNNSNDKIVRMADKILSWQTPFKLTDTVKEYFRQIAPMQKGYEDKYSDIENALKDDGFVEHFTENKEFNSLVRDTISLTMLESGSKKVNVIPSETMAGFDCRLLPITDKKDFRGEMEKHIADDGGRIEMIQEDVPSPESPFDTELYEIISTELRDRHPDIIVTPFISTGATDSRFFRQYGVVAYGFAPFAMTRDEFLGCVHGHNERISLDNIKNGVKLYYDIVEKIVF